MVHTWSVKKEVYKIYKPHLKDELNSWLDCKAYIKKEFPSISVKVLNWYAHVLYQRVNKSDKSIFDYYMSRISESKRFKNIQKRTKE